jgi:hypothetical protein
MICTQCNTKFVPEPRVEAGYTTCMSCASNVRKVRGNMVIPHKTGSYLEVMSADYYDENKRFFISRPGARSLMARFK